MQTLEGLGGQRHGMSTAGLALGLALQLVCPGGQAEENVYLADTPDYSWYAGCYGTSCGNLIAYWDRHGFPDFYTGPTAGGVAPLDDNGSNRSIRALWTSKAGRDGRPEGQPGHEDDYWVKFETSADDPYLTEGRPEHDPDCIGDFIGLSQKKWRNLGGECDGNIDGYSYIYWDSSGLRRDNFTPTEAAGEPAIDLQSGLRDWARFRGYAADTFTQLADFNSEIQGPGTGYSFEDVKAEIQAGYPLLAHMQSRNTPNREIGDMPRANPNLHAVMIYGYHVDAAGRQFARIRTSWASGDFKFEQWRDAKWLGDHMMPVRGVIGFHPLPQIIDSERTEDTITLRWVGPDAVIVDQITGARRKLHWYVVEKSTTLNAETFEPISAPTTAREWTGPECCATDVFYRIRLISPLD